MVAALRHHPQHLRFLKLAEADRARGFAVAAFRRRVLEPRVRVDHVRVQTRHARPLFFVAVLGDEDDARKNNAVGGAAAVVAESAAAEVGREDEG